MKKVNFRVLISSVAFFALAFTVIIPSGCSMNKDPLPSWRGESENKKVITNYIKDVTDEKSENFIPIEKRIVTFDLDGTLMCERPNYLELTAALDRIENDPSYTASEELKAKAREVKYKQSTDPKGEGADDLSDEILGLTFAGIPRSEYYEYVKKFAQNKMTDFDNLTYAQAFYKPMIEVVNYLQDNNFTVYIASGSDRSTIYAAIEGVIDIPRGQVIGSDYAFRATNQSSPDDISYQLQPGDEFIRLPNLVQKDIKITKANNIIKEIGEYPVMAFGNSGGDFSMLDYTLSNPNYKSCAFLLQHDDSEREYDYAKSDRSSWTATANKSGWGIVSMQAEFNTIFGKDVHKSADSSNLQPAA